MPFDAKNMGIVLQIFQGSSIVFFSFAFKILGRRKGAKPFRPPPILSSSLNPPLLSAQTTYCISCVTRLLTPVIIRLVIPNALN